MKIRIDNILLCVLWLLAVTLGASFWFNTVFGFDIFSSAHWEYIALLQASHSPIKTGFYVSMAITIFVAIFGLYLVVRPRIRKIRLPIMRVDMTHNKTTTNIEQHQDNVIQSNSDASTLDLLQAEEQKYTPNKVPSNQSNLARPPRLTLPTINNNFMSMPAETTMSSHLTTRTTPTDEDTLTIQKIFINTGYTVKPNVTLNGIKTVLIAIGTNETMWLGCMGAKTTDVRGIIEKFQQIFSDTLDETEISINGFVIDAPDAATSEFQDILMFNTIKELQDYIKNRHNPPLPDDDDGMFEAYSQYIDAVITHIGKI